MRIFTDIEGAAGQRGNTLIQLREKWIIGSTGSVSLVAALEQDGKLPDRQRFVKGHVVYGTASALGVVVGELLASPESGLFHSAPHLGDELGFGVAGFAPV